MALVERCRQGDLGAFEELYRAHAGKLFSVACRMLGNTADAEDLLQEIFLSAHRKLDWFRGEAALAHDVAHGPARPRMSRCFRDVAIRGDSARRNSSDDGQDAGGK